ncbi:hypothetical protein PUN28_009266 [Cardiocondyla obscurior]|uniref:Uncharacterized protein n=1 Tax=Cardiocondyla obscurior TaxID=286306 RepID=A0AAW2FTB6_9HYME
MRRGTLGFLHHPSGAGYKAGGRHIHTHTHVNIRCDRSKLNATIITAAIRTLHCNVAQRIHSAYGNHVRLSILDDHSPPVHIDQ